MNAIPRFADDAWLAAIIDSSEDAIISKTTTGIITSWNGAARRLFGYEADEVLGQPILLLFPPDRLQEEEQILARIRAGERVEHFETERLRRDGQRIPLSVTISPIRDAEGHIVGASKIARDIRERKALQQRLQDLNEALELRVADRTRALEMANRELDAFTSAVSHDLRAPLRAMAGFSQALHEDFATILPEDGQGYLQQISEAVRRMDTLVLGLLDLSRHTRAELQRKPVHLDDLIRASWRTLERAHGSPLTGLTMACPHPVSADERMLQVVLDNLLGNAVKYTQPGRSPVVHVCQHIDAQGHVWINVRDQGLGFEQDAAGSMFEPFTRLHHAGTYPGLGLGLATVQRIVQRHGGQIHAIGTVGAGATFRFHLGAVVDAGQHRTLDNTSGPP